MAIMITMMMIITAGTKSAIITVITIGHGVIAGAITIRAARDRQRIYSLKNMFVLTEAWAATPPRRRSPLPRIQRASLAL